MYVHIYNLHICAADGRGIRVVPDLEYGPARSAVFIGHWPDKEEVWYPSYYLLDGGHW